MIDHLEVYSDKVPAMVAFYARVLGILGYTQKVSGRTNGFGTETMLDFFVAEGSPGQHVHFAFAARDRATVDRIYADARTAGFVLDRAPALAPHIHPNYYAGYLRDPDGRLVEFVCHKPE